MRSRPVRTTKLILPCTWDKNLPRRRLTPATLQHLQRYDWPGNVRELQNVLERALIVSPGQDLRVDLLDGGHLMFLLIEKIKGKPLSLKTQVVSTVVGLAAILLIALIVTFQDIGRLFQ